MRMLSVELSDELCKAVRHQAVDENTTLRDVVQKALSKYLCEVETEGKETT